jgi:hypothetical protein
MTSKLFEAINEGNVKMGVRELATRALEKERGGAHIPAMYGGLAEGVKDAPLKYGPIGKVEFAPKTYYDPKEGALDKLDFNMTRVMPSQTYKNDHPEMTKLPYKYDEDRLLAELRTYIDSTYKGHYVGENNVQSLDLIFATGHGEGFTLGNIQKYSSRAGKKKGQERADLLKVIHYGLLALYLYDKNNKKDS